MADGDLVVDDYMFEFNNLVIGATTDFDIQSVTGLLGFKGRTSSVDRFGRHGGTSGRHYGAMRNIVIQGNIRGTTDTDIETKRRALGNAFSMITDPFSRKPLVLQLPGATATKYQTLVRPLDLEMPLDRSHALKYLPFIIRLEQIDPILYSHVEISTSFALPFSQRFLTNNGNAPAPWVGTLIGPAVYPTIGNLDTNQLVTFPGLVIPNGEALIIDSFNSTVKLSSTSVSSYLASGFSWFDLDPGTTQLYFAAGDAAAASFSITHRDAYWIP